MRQAPPAHLVSVAGMSATGRAQILCEQENDLWLFSVQHCHAQAKWVLDRADTSVEQGGRGKVASGSKQLARQERDLLVQLLRLRQACCHMQAVPYPTLAVILTCKGSVGCSVTTCVEEDFWGVSDCLLCVAQVGEGAVDKLKGKPMSMSAILEVNCSSMPVQPCLIACEASTAEGNTFHAALLCLGRPMLLREEWSACRP